MWPTGPLERRFARILLDGAWAGAAGAAVGFLVFTVGESQTTHDQAQSMAHAVWLALILLGMALPFAWITDRARLPLMPLGLGYGLLFAAATRFPSAHLVLAFVLYGATVALVLAQRRRERRVIG